jgi:hypothetical protein
VSVIELGLSLLEEKDSVLTVCRFLRVVHFIIDWMMIGEFFFL